MNLLVQSASFAQQSRSGLPFPSPRREAREELNT